MGVVGEGGRPLEDILRRLDNLSPPSRPSPEIDLREPPSHVVPPPVPPEAPPPADTEPVIDLRAPAAAPVPTRIIEPGDRSVARTVSSEPETGSRYGRHGVVAPVASRTRRTPHNVPVLPVSVKDDAPPEAPDAAAQPPMLRWTILVSALGILLLAIVAVLTVL